MGPAVAAVCAKPGRNPSEEGKAAEKPQERAEGTEVPAPVSPLEPLQYQDHCKEDERNEGEGVEGLPKREQVALEEAVARVQVIPRISEDPVKSYPSLSGQKTDERVKGEGEEADEDRHGIKETGEVHVEEGCKEEGEEQIIFEPAFEEGEGASLLYPFRHQVYDRTQGADPAAKKPAQDEREQENQKAGQEKEREGLGRQEVAHGNEGIGPEEGVEGYGNLVLAPVVGRDKEEEKNGQEEKLKNAGQTDLHRRRS